MEASLTPALSLEAAGSCGFDLISAGRPSAPSAETGISPTWQTVPGPNQETIPTAAAASVTSRQPRLSMLRAAVRSNSSTQSERLCARPASGKSMRRSSQLPIVGDWHRTRAISSPGELHQAGVCCVDWLLGLIVPKVARCVIVFGSHMCAPSRSSQASTNEFGSAGSRGLPCRGLLACPRSGDAMVSGDTPEPSC